MINQHGEFLYLQRIRWNPVSKDSGGILQFLEIDSGMMIYTISRDSGILLNFEILEYSFLDVVECTLSRDSWEF
jgi:hypothetical protein